MKHALQTSVFAILLFAMAACATSEESKKSAPSPSRLDEDDIVVSSQIVGDFAGWNGNTVFELTNGDRWQQTRYSYVYTVDRSPRVKIYKTNSGYVMKVEDVKKTVYVRKISR